MLLMAISGTASGISVRYKSRLDANCPPSLTFLDIALIPIPRFPMLDIPQLPFCLDLATIWIYKAWREFSFFVTVTFACELREPPDFQGHV